MLELWKQGAGCRVGGGAAGLGNQGRLPGGEEWQRWTGGEWREERVHPGCLGPLLPPCEETTQPLPTSFLDEGTGARMLEWVLWLPGCLEPVAAVSGGLLCSASGSHMAHQVLREVRESPPFPRTKPCAKSQEESRFKTPLPECCCPAHSWAIPHMVPPAFCRLPGLSSPHQASQAPRE